MQHRSINPRRRLVRRVVIATGVGVGAGALALAAIAQASPAGPLKPALSASANHVAASDHDRDHARPKYTLRTLDDRADPTFNQLLGINDNNKIVGYFGSGADAAHPNKGYRLLVPYRQQDYRNENFPGSVQTQVIGVSNGTTTVGFYVDAAGASFGFVRSPGGRYTSVRNPATPTTNPVNQLLGVNNHRVAVGFYNDAAGAAHGYTYDIEDGTFRPVVLPVPADAVTATSINDEGDVAGFYAVGKSTFGFVFEHHQFRPLSFGAGTNTQALGVNDGDRVVGSYVDAAGKTHGYSWLPGQLTTLDDPHAAGNTVVNGLNNRGRLVGFYVDAAGNTHGFLATQSDDD